MAATDGSPNVLYRFYSACDQLLYVGITTNPPARFKNHQRSKTWWDEITMIRMAPYSSKAELLRAERLAIQCERPKYNVVHNKNPRISPRTRETYPIADILRWDITDAGYVIVIVRCPFCGNHHRHFAPDGKDDRSRESECHSGDYELAREVTR